jgi:diaphanous 1
MSTDPLVVPLVLVTGSLHFVQVQEDARADDVVEAALDLEGLRDEVLGDLEDSGWALQRIRTEQPGRTWEEDELLSLGDGMSPLEPGPSYF